MIKERFTSSSDEVLFNNSDLRPVRLLGAHNSKDALQKHLTAHKNVLSVKERIDFLSRNLFPL